MLVVITIFPREDKIQLICHYSASFGRLNETTNTYSVSTGYKNTNSGYCSIAMGLEQTVSNSYSAVIGRLNESWRYVFFYSGL